MSISEDSHNPNLFDTLFYAQDISELEGIDLSLDEIDLYTCRKEKMKDALEGIDEELSKLKSFKLKE